MLSGSAQRRIAAIGETMVIAALYFATARLALLLAFQNTNASPVWPPSGLALALVLLRGRGVWPGLLIGAWLANVVTFANAGTLGGVSACITAAAIAAGNVAEALVGAWLLNRIIGRDQPLWARPRNVVVFAACVAFACLIASANGASALMVSGVIPRPLWGVVCSTWWIGDVVGTLVVCPMLLSWFWPHERAPGRWRSTTWILYVGAAIAGYLAFVDTASLRSSLIAPLPALAMLFWAVLSFGVSEAVTVTAIMSGIAIWRTVHGSGPFVRVQLNDALLLLQVTVGVGIVTILLMVSALRSARRSVPSDAVARPTTPKTWSPAAIVVGVIGLAVTIGLWRSLQDEQERRIDASVRAEATHIGERLQSAMTASANSVRRMSERWHQRGGTPYQEWVHDTAAYIRDDSWLSAIAWVDATRTIRWIAPVEENKAAIGMDLDADPERRRAMDRARTAVYAMTEMVDLRQGGVGSLVYFAIGSEDRPEYISGLFRVDVLLSHLRATSNARFAVSIRDGSGRVAGDDATKARRWSCAITQPILDRQWQIEVAALPLLLQSLHSPLPTVALCLGSALTALLSIAIHLAQVSRQQNRDVRAANRLLEERTEDLVKANQAAKWSEERFRAVVQSANAAIITAGPDGLIRSWNAGAARIFGFSDDEMLGQPLMKIMPERFREAHAQGLRRVSTGTPSRLVGTTVALEGLRKDGSEFPIELSLGNWRDEDGLNFSGVIMDITERKRAQDLIGMNFAKAAEFERMVELSLTPMCIANTQGYFIRVNQACVDILGWSADELTTTPYREFLHPDDLERTTREASSLAAGTNTEAFENRYRCRDGSYRNLLWTASVDLAAQRIYCVAHDLTKFKQMEVALIAARNAAESAAQAKSAFLASMSHEIRTPMNGIIGMISILLESELSSDQRLQAQTVGNSADALLTIVNDLLDFSKIEAGAMRIESTPFDLPRIVADVVDLIGIKAREKNLQLKVSIESGLPERLLGDSGRIRQILINLLGNSIKFTPSGSVVLSIAQLAGSGSTIRFSIKDTGIGIAADKMPLLFQRFMQADSSTTRKFGGTGLGLAISKRLAELMQGALTVESEEGIGSTFHLDLPLSAAPQKIGAAAEPVQIHTPLSPWRVMVAEDNPVNQRVAAMHLRKLGCTVDLAANGLEALALEAQFAFDLILMDCQMPEMDGFEATKLLRERRPAGSRRVPIVALTANAMPEDIDRCLAVGMDAHLAKPLYIDNLRQLLRRLQAASTSSTT